jgi:molybdate transport system substrate-binding protein
VYGSRRREKGHKREYTYRSARQRSGTDRGQSLQNRARRHRAGLDLAKLADDGRIATGDVKEVPVGLYAKAALEKLGVWLSVEAKMAMTVNVRAALAYVARGEAPLGIVYATDARIEPGVKVVGVFPDSSHDPIIYPVAATVNAKPKTMQYLAFLRSAVAKSIFEGYGFSVLAKPTS